MFKKKYKPTVVILGHGVESTKISFPEMPNMIEEAPEELLDGNLIAALETFKALTLTHSQIIPLDVTRVMNTIIDKLRVVLESATRDSIGQRYENIIERTIQEVLPKTVENYVNLAEQYKTAETHKILFNQCEDILTQVDEIIEYTEGQTLSAFQAHAKYVEMSTDQMAIEKAEREQLIVDLPSMLERQQNKQA